MVKGCLVLADLGDICIEIPWMHFFELNFGEGVDYFFFGEQFLAIVFS